MLRQLRRNTHRGEGTHTHSCMKKLAHRHTKDVQIVFPPAPPLIFKKRQHRKAREKQVSMPPTQREHRGELQFVESIFCVCGNLMPNIPESHRDQVEEHTAKCIKYILKLKGFHLQAAGHPRKQEWTCDTTIFFVIRKNTMTAR